MRVMRRLLDAAFLVSEDVSGDRNGRAGVSTRTNPVHKKRSIQQGTHYALRFIIPAQHVRYAEISTLTRVALSV